MVEQKGTNNNAGFPVINAKRIAKATPAQKDKQKSQLNIFAKNSLPWICTHSITPHLRNKVNPNAATKALVVNQLNTFHQFPIPRQTGTRRTGALKIDYLFRPK